MKWTFFTALSACNVYIKRVCVCVRVRVRERVCVMVLLRE